MKAKLKRLLKISLVVLNVSGCSHNGWFAIPQQHKELSGLSPQYEAIDHHRQMASNQLGVMRLSGGQQCLPASIFTIATTLDKAKQSLQGQRLTDAANQVILAQQHLIHSQKRLNYLKQNTPCATSTQVPKTPNTHDRIAMIELMLNSNNQFATDKDELTVSYQQQLTNAAQQIQKLANEQTSLIIALTGHADRRGDDNYNQALSKRRSIQVKQFLIAQGIKPHQITIKSQGASQPISQNNNPSAWLANRRVSATLTTATKTAKNPSKSLVLRDWWLHLEQPNDLKIGH